MSNLPAYRKTVTAVVGAVFAFAALVVTSAPTRVTSGEWLFGATGLATALGVYGVSNEPKRRPDAWVPAEFPGEPDA